MNAYIVTAESGDRQEVRFAASQTEAAGARKTFIADGFKRNELETHTVDVPTGKGALIEFLNQLCAGPSVIAASRKLLGG
jgi:hypothetical protein